eukprot:1933524-Pleurochrysis_carterae.AAC.1
MMFLALFFSSPARACASPLHAVTASPCGGAHAPNTPYLLALRGAHPSIHAAYDLLGALAVAVTSFSSSGLSVPWLCAACIIQAYFIAGGRLLRVPPPRDYSRTTTITPFPPFRRAATTRSSATRALHLTTRCCAAAASLSSRAYRACDSCAVTLCRLPARSRAAALAAARACLLRATSPRSTLAVCAGRLTSLP